MFFKSTENNMKTCVKLFNGFGVGITGSSNKTGKHFLYHPENTQNTVNTLESEALASLQVALPCYSHRK